MCDAGIEEGDQVHVLLDTPVYDGDIVVACIDGECTVKAYLKDKDGTVWLVPCNKAYRPIRITEEMNAHIVGKVISHRKPAPRAWP
jgi:SOS-response transcriptional repressor LexA